MGYKGTMRSLNSAANKAAKERERRERQKQRELERLQKKLQKIIDKKRKIEDALKHEYTKGKLSEDTYSEYKKRLNDISDILIVFGKTPAVTLCKRYVTGKIEKEEFEKLKLELIPKGVTQEEQEITKLAKDTLNSFKDLCTTLNEKENCCSMCGKKKGFFNLFSSMDNHSFCRKCKMKYRAAKTFSGFNGNYLTTEAYDLEPEVEKISITVNIRNEHL